MRWLCFRKAYFYSKRLTFVLRFVILLVTDVSDVTDCYRTRRLFHNLKGIDFDDLGGGAFLFSKIGII